MTLHRDHRPTRPSTGALVLSRNVREGFSLAEDCRFDVLHLTAQFVNLAITDGSHSTGWRLEVGDALQITGGTVACLRQARYEPGPLEVRVKRVTTHHATLLVHAPRSLEIVRHDLSPTGRAS